MVLTNVLSKVHGSHSRSLLAVGGIISPSPDAQSAWLVQLLLPSVSNVPAAHGVHTRLDVSVGTWLSYSPARQTDKPRQARSVVAVGGTASYCISLQLERAVQARSVDVVTGDVSYCATVHRVAARQGCPWSGWYVSGGQWLHVDPLAPGMQMAVVATAVVAISSLWSTHVM